MNKAQLVEEVANETGLTRKVSREVLDAVVSAVNKSVEGEEKALRLALALVRLWKDRTREESSGGISHPDPAQERP